MVFPGAERSQRVMELPGSCITALIPAHVHTRLQLCRLLQVAIQIQLSSIPPHQTVLLSSENSVVGPNLVTKSILRELLAADVPQAGKPSLCTRVPGASTPTRLFTSWKRVVSCYLASGVLLCYPLSCNDHTVGQPQALSSLPEPFPQPPGTERPCLNSKGKTWCLWFSSNLIHAMVNTKTPKGEQELLLPHCTFSRFKNEQVAGRNVTHWLNRSWCTLRF